MASTTSSIRRRRSSALAPPSPTQRTHLAHKGRDHHHASQPKSRLEAILAAVFADPAHATHVASWSAAVLTVLGVAFFLRAAVARHGYSGRGMGPKYGDFEAQRHWLELTTHLPASQWYYYKLDHWGLDYPPLTAYVSWFFGVIAHVLDPTWVALDASWGIETPAVVAFMRGTVYFSDLVIYVPACVVFVRHAIGRERSLHELYALAVLLLFPGLVLVDHGHFQYNLIMLGLSMYAVVFMDSGHYVASAIAFSLALLFKQMALYYALPVFVFLLSKCFSPGNGFRLFVKLGCAVLVTFALHAWPFRYDLPQVLHRVFPVARGLYEDKVANVWCAISPVIKLRMLFTQPQLVRISMITTLAASAPSLGALFATPTLHRLLLSMFAVSMSFFLFAFQVHEKSILLPMTPALMLMAYRPRGHAHWVAPMQALATFSMWPLLSRDGLAVPYAVLTGGWWILTVPRSASGLRRWAMWAGLIVCLGLHAVEAMVPPPSRYPDAWVLANQAVACGGFVVAWAWATWLAVRRSE
ncbi:glycosyl transferase [Blastocladiella britannica]|nr:glycosyl transferase [Blastocladiella britannica]